jgi:hypothetical protein
MSRCGSASAAKDGIIRPGRQPKSQSAAVVPVRRLPGPDGAAGGELVPIIDRWAAGKEPEALAVRCARRGPLQESNWKRSLGWRAARVAAGVPDVRVHDLRHSAASLWLSLARIRSGCSGMQPRRWPWTCTAT